MVIKTQLSCNKKNHFSKEELRGIGSRKCWVCSVVIRAGEPERQRLTVAGPSDVSCQRPGPREVCATVVGGLLV